MPGSSTVATAVLRADGGALSESGLDACDGVIAAVAERPAAMRATGDGACSAGPDGVAAADFADSNLRVTSASACTGIAVCATCRVVTGGADTASWIC